jgi:hypothetical protein
MPVGPAGAPVRLRGQELLLKKKQDKAGTSSFSEEEARESGDYRASRTTPRAAHMFRVVSGAASECTRSAAIIACGGLFRDCQ